MKILIITELLAPYRVDWFNELGKLASVKVLYTKSKEFTRKSVWLDNKIKNFECKKLKSLKIRDREISLEVISELRKDYDIILLDGYAFITQVIAICYLKIKNKKFFMNIDGGIIKSKENRLIKKIKKFFIQSPSFYLSSSYTTDKYLEFYGAKKSNIYHHKFTSLYEKDILSDIVSEDEKNKIRDKLGISRDAHVIISVGRFIKLKGFDILIKSVKFIKDKKVIIYIVGGEATDEYIELIEKYKIENVIFVDFKDKEKLREYYKMSDLFVLPTRQDVWGLVINEAMSVGLPIITTNKCVAGIELVSNYENGFIIAPNDEKELAKKIDEILLNKNMKINMSNCSLERIKKYTIENLAKTHYDIFKNYMNESEENCE